jgi:hypothetical protein
MEMTSISHVEMLEEAVKLGFVTCTTSVADVVSVCTTSAVDVYLKPGKAPGPSKVPNDLIKKESSIEMKILRAWTDQILVTEKLTPDILCEEDVHGVISLFHKGGGTTIHPSDWSPVVLMDSMNQLLGDIVLERLTRLAEGSNILEEGQGGYWECESAELYQFCYKNILHFVEH